MVKCQINIWKITLIQKISFNCYGCELCKDICPVHAIEMKEDKEGFKYPKIDEEKCIKCGLCEKNCIYQKEYELKNDKVKGKSKEEIKENEEYPLGVMLLQIKMKKY